MNNSGMPNRDNDLAGRYERIWRGLYDRRALTSREEFSSLLHYSQKQQDDHQHLALRLVSRCVPDGMCLLLDVGCGTGTYIRHLAAGASKVEPYGVDISLNLLGRGGNQHLQLRGRLVQGTVSELPFRSGRFDVVLSMGVLQTVGDVEVSIREICRTVKPGGYAIISTLRRHSVWELPFLAWPLFRHYFEQDRASGELLKMIRSREHLAWREIPPDFPPKKYSFACMRTLLSRSGMVGIKCFFPENPSRWPMLLNSFHMFIVARKPSGADGSPKSREKP